MYVINCTNNGAITSGVYAASVGGFRSYQSTGTTSVYGHTNSGTITGNNVGAKDTTGQYVILGADGYGTVYQPADAYNCVPGENGAYVITKK